MKILIYSDNSNIDINFIKELVYKTEIEKRNKIETLIVNVDLYLKLRDEGMRKENFLYQYWYRENRFDRGIKIHHFKIISSYEMENEIIASFE